MKRFRDCGCDDRDAGTYEQDATPSPLLCESCVEMPCCWVARFECFVGDAAAYSAATKWLTDASGNVYMRVRCAFDDPCRFVSDATESLSTRHGDGWTSYSFNLVAYTYCTWNERHLIAAVDDPHIVVDGWVLDLQSLDAVQLINSEHGITYEAVSAWDCTGPNTMALSGGRGEFPTLPATICVVPNTGFTVANPFLGTSDGVPAHLCDESEPTVDHDQCDERLPCGYTGDDRLACCDDCCDKPVSLTFSCTGDITATLSGTATVSERTPQQSADGQVYELFGDVTIGGTTYNVGTVLYCSGGTWTSDIYCDDVFEQTITIPTTCCPLAGTTTWTMLCMDCTVCIAIGDGECEPPPPPVETDCCPDDPTPQTLHFTMTDVSTAGSCSPIDVVTGELTYDAAISDWHGMTSCGEADGWLGRLEFGDGSCDGWILLQCCAGTWEGEYRSDSGTWTSGLTFTGGAPPYDQSTTCSPFELLAVFYTGLGPVTCCDSSNGVDNIIKITITA